VSPSSREARAGYEFFFTSEVAKWEQILRDVRCSDDRSISV
jgi:hypothetical protein